MSFTVTQFLRVQKRAPNELFATLSFTVTQFLRVQKPPMPLF